MWTLLLHIFCLYMVISYPCMVMKSILYMHVSGHSQNWQVFNNNKTAASCGMNLLSTHTPIYEDIKMVKSKERWSKVNRKRENIYKYVCKYVCAMFFFFFSICLDVPHLTNEHRTHHCTTSWRGQLCILPV